MRVTLFNRPKNEYILLITLDHIICDGWSFWLLLDELPKLYLAEISGVKADLRPLNFSYLDYIQWQSDLLNSYKGEEHWNYWQKQLSGELPILNLTTDRPRPARIELDHPAAVQRRTGQSLVLGCWRWRWPSSLA